MGDIIMKSNLKLVMGTFCLISMATGVYAADQVHLGEVSYDGTACPEGSITIHTDEDRNTLDFQSGTIKAQAGEAAKKTVDLRDCSINVPVQVAAGYRVSVAPMNYSGNVYLPYGTSSRMYVNYYFEYPYGMAQQNFRYTWFGEQISNFTLEAPRKKTDAPVWSNCGESFRLRMSLSLLAQTNRFNHNASVAVDRMTGFELKTEKCE
jgi:hypothetical protein